MTPSGPRRGSSGGNNNNLISWVVTLVAAVVVIGGGWFLGQGLAHWLGPKDQQTALLATPTPKITPLASPASSPTAAATAQSSPTLAPTAAPTQQATVAPTVAPTPAPTIARTAPPTAQPTPVPTPRRTPVATTAGRTTLPVARRPEPTNVAEDSASTLGGAAETTVRSYLDALRRGDPQSAASYLGNGEPDEDFIDANTRIASVNTTRNSDGSYKVVVDMQTAKGEYSETFVVAGTANGTRILEKTAIKP